MDLENLIQKAAEEIATNPYGITAYRELVSYIDATKTRAPVAYWKIKAHHEAITSDDIESWEDAIDKEFQSEHDRVKELVALYKAVSSQLPISSYKAYYLDWYKKLSEFEPCNNPSVIDLATTLYKQNSRDFLHSEVIFSRLVKFLGSDDLTLFQLYEQRIRIPHKYLELTFQTLCSIVSRINPDLYAGTMRRYSKIKRETERSQRYYDRIYSEITSDSGNPSVWAKYLESVYKYDKPSLLLVFYDSLSHADQFGKGDESWLPLWTFILKALDQHDNLAEKKAFLDSFLKTYPTRVEPYSELLYADLSQFQNIKQRISQEKVGSDPKLVKDILTIMVFLSKQGNGFELDVNDILHYCNFLSDIGGMKFMVSLFAFSPTISTAIVTDYLNKYSQNAEIWSLALETFAFHKQQDTIATLLCNWEDNYLSYDKPALCLDAVQAYYSANAFTVDKLLSSHATLREVYADIKKNESVSTTETYELKRKIEPESESDSSSKTSVESPQAKKPKTQHESSEPQRSREQFRIKVSPINDAKENDIEDFFKECAIPLSIVISSEPNSESFAVVELASENDVLICLSRHLKPLLGSPVNIERIFGNTVWMTNYPPELSVDGIRDLVSKVSNYTPISIRVPSQQDTSERRFCYMDFADATSALSVVKSLSDHEVNGYKLHAEISNPSLRKHKNTKNAALQIYLRNLNFKVSDKNSIRNFASKIGTVDSVNVPLSEANKNKGYKNNGYAFVTFTTEEARERALALQSAEIDGRTVTISAVNIKAENQNQASHFDNSSTITIRGVNEHVAAEYLRKFVEEKVGPVARIQLKPSKNMALLEFKTVKDSGRAEFLLQGAQLESQTLQIGPKKDFFAAEQTISVPKMMPPSLMRRRKK